jgi:hypothetical protein
VRIFPGNVPVVHPIVALIAFVSGGAAAVLAYIVTTPPFRYVSVMLGVIVLMSDVLGLWLSIFGGYLIGPSRREPLDTY